MNDSSFKIKILTDIPIMHAISENYPNLVLRATCLSVGMLLMPETGRPVMSSAKATMSSAKATMSSAKATTWKMMQYV